MNHTIPKRMYIFLFPLLIFLLILPAGARTYTDGFTDVPKDAWYHEYVSAAYEMGIIDGKTENRYDPDGCVTVAECIKLASCIVQVKTDGEVTLTNGSEIWYDPYVQYALAKGILTEPCTDYNAYASRARIAQIFSAVLAEEEPILNTPGNLCFRDAADENAWYYDDVYRMYGCGIMVGDDTYRFRPDGEICRSEMAAVAVRMLDKDKRVSHTFHVPEQVETAILMYHNFAEQPADYTVTPATFRSHLRALSAAGYESITFAELLLYTEGRIPLPEKCVLLTSDDGYSGVLDIALPLLAEFDMKMSVAVIGNLIGSRGEGTLSHFTLEEVSAADTEGRIELVSHSWGLHASGSYLDGAVNLNMTEDGYASTLQEDYEKIAAEAGDRFPMMKKVFVYPYGKHSPESEAWLASAGYKVTVTVAQGVSRIAVGDSLTLLKRIPAEWYATGEQLLRKLQ
ncbi:MAG: S-layer homology domain-containing protein [Clostridia bacterium]|nr:S-layer homology domain-containing protein [Clostridia bacterium]